MGLASEEGLVDCSIYVCVTFEYVSFPIGMFDAFFHIRNLWSVALAVFRGGTSTVGICVL